MRFFELATFFLAWACAWALKPKPVCQAQITRSAIESYAQALAKLGSGGGITDYLACFAGDGNFTVEDPVGLPAITTKAALSQSIEQLKLKFASNGYQVDFGDIDVSVDPTQAGVSFKLITLNADGSVNSTYNITDTIQVNNAGEIVSLKAYWDPGLSNSAQAQITRSAIESYAQALAKLGSGGGITDYLACFAGDGNFTDEDPVGNGNPAISTKAALSQSMEQLKSKFAPNGNRVDFGDIAVSVDPTQAGVSFKLITLNADGSVNSTYNITDAIQVNNAGDIVSLKAYLNPAPQC